jgi:ubiquinone/menaquinone biosynthesis C-methylase UbiE
VASLRSELLARINGLLPARGTAVRDGKVRGYSALQYEWARHDLEIFQGELSLAGKKVLDAGCGPGGKTMFFADQGPSEITGVDVTETSIETARKFAAERGKTNVRFEVSGLEQLPFADASFDLVLMTDVLEHVARPLLGPVLDSLRRVLKDGGELALYFPPWSSFDASHLYNEIYLPWCHLLFDDETLMSVLEKLHKGDEKSLARTREHYRALNRLTIDEFDRLIAEHGFTPRYYRHKTIKDLPIPRSLPIEPLLTKRVVAILQKR